jgi:hypothetical protein
LKEGEVKNPYKKPKDPMKVKMEVCIVKDTIDVA